MVIDDVCWPKIESHKTGKTHFDKRNATDRGNHWKLLPAKLPFFPHRKISNIQNAINNNDIILIQFSVRFFSFVCIFSATFSSQSSRDYILSLCKQHMRSRNTHTECDLPRVEMFENAKMIFDFRQQILRFNFVVSVSTHFIRFSCFIEN